MARLYQNYLGGRLDVAVDDEETTLSSPAFVALREVEVGDEMVITLDPDGLGGAPETVLVVEHQDSSPTVTVLRGQDTHDGGSAGRPHPVGTNWVHGPVASDLRMVSVKDVEDASYLVSIADFGQLLRFTDAGPVVVSLPAGAPVGSQVSLLFWGAGGGSVQDDGVSEVTPAGSVPQYSEVSCVVVAPGVWSVQGAVS